jgi:molybdopterin converting factor small subunit
MQIEINFYAQLKDYFGETMHLEIAQANAAGIRAALTQKNALAAEWLKVSRLASEDAFLGEDAQLSSGSRYFLLPPSSGG